MKNVKQIVGILFIVASLFSTKAGAQVNAMAADTTASLVSLSATYIYPKVYLKWLIKNQKSDGLFVIEIEKNGEFKTIGAKECVGTTVDIPLLYCFNYSDSAFTSSKFRVRCFSEDKRVLVSTEYYLHYLPIEDTAEQRGIEMHRISESKAEDRPRLKTQPGTF